MVSVLYYGDIFTDDGMEGHKFSVDLASDCIFTSVYVGEK